MQVNILWHINWIHYWDKYTGTCVYLWEGQLSIYIEAIWNVDLLVNRNKCLWTNIRKKTTKNIFQFYYPLNFNSWKFILLWSSYSGSKLESHLLRIFFNWYLESTLLFLIIFRRTFLHHKTFMMLHTFFFILLCEALRNT